jgi:tetratricopeptide (TPR) repeat protein
MILPVSFHRMGAAFAIASLAVLVGCVGGGGGRPIATPGATPPVASAAAGNSVQGLYESGRYREVLNSVNAGNRSAEAVWFAAQSNLRLGQREEAAGQFAQLPQVGGNPAWQVVSDLALALLGDDIAEIDRASEAAAALQSDPFVQHQLGLAHLRRNDFAAAAQAFDRATQADPRFAYAYYNGGLAYDRLNRTDLVIARLEMFERLAPDAPERPEVASILRTVRSR